MCIREHAGVTKARFPAIQRDHPLVLGIKRRHGTHGRHPTALSLFLVSFVLTHKQVENLLPLSFSHFLQSFAGLMSTNNSNTVLVPSRLRSIFKRFRSSSSRPATTAASGTATTIDGNQMIHHVEATSSITKREPSLPPTPPVSLQTRSNEILDELTQQFAVSTHKMRAIVSHFVSEMQKGLQNEGETGILRTHAEDDVLALTPLQVAMIPTFVTGRPTGQEKGKYLALDLGGTYLRVCEVSLHGNRDFGIHQQKYKVPGALKLGEMTQLCDFIAECVNNFLSEQGHDDIDPEAPLQLGFTFSFPVFQTSINRGVLKQWTKGFSCKNAVDKDVVVMLQDAFSRKKVPVNIAAVCV